MNTKKGKNTAIPVQAEPKGVGGRAKIKRRREGRKKMRFIASPKQGRLFARVLKKNIEAGTLCNKGRKSPVPALQS